MGERGAIVLMPPGAEPDIDALGENPNAIILYTHWGGPEIPSLLQEAIQKIGIEKARDPQALRDALSSSDMTVASWLEYSYPPLMVSPSEGVIYFDVDESDYQWARWTYEEFVKLSPKDLAILEDVSQKEQLERQQEERDQRDFKRRQDERAARSKKNEYLSSLAISSIPIGIAGAIGLANYFKSSNQQQ